MIKVTVPFLRCGALLVLAGSLAHAGDFEKRAQDSAKNPLELAQAFESAGFTNLAKAEYVEAAKTKSTAALSALFELADRTDDRSFLDFAVEKLKGTDAPVTKTPEFHFREGEALMAKGKFEAASAALALVPTSSPRSFKSRYLQALAQVKSGKLPQALARMKELEAETASASEANYDRNVAIAGLARLNYKMGQWDKALEYYRQIPKDSDLWREILTEMSWADFRRGNFREVLGTLDAAHSPYFENDFMMESALLRSFVYLSICSLDEMEKTLNLIEKMYIPMSTKLSQTLAGIKTYSEFYQKAPIEIPQPFVRALDDDPRFKRADAQVRSLRAENWRLAQLSPAWKSSQLGRDTSNYLENRLNESIKQAGKQARAHLEARQKEIEKLFQQYDFAKYEMTSASKHELREHGPSPESVGTPLRGTPPTQSPGSGTTVDDLDRNFFLTRGIEFYPFRGEYWLDEIGNSHFIGRSRCAKN